MPHYEHYHKQRHARTSQFIAALDTHLCDNLLALRVIDPRLGLGPCIGGLELEVNIVPHMRQHLGAGLQLLRMHENNTGKTRSRGVISSPQEPYLSGTHHHNP